MTVSNLGIIFGPTLVKPQQTDAEVSLSSLVDYPYQVLMVELLVRHFHLVFDNPPLQGSETARNSPRLTPQQKVRQLSKHSTSLTDIKEVRMDQVLPHESCSHPWLGVAVNQPGVVYGGGGRLYCSESGLSSQT